MVAVVTIFKKVATDKSLCWCGGCPMMGSMFIVEEDCSVTLSITASEGEVVIVAVSRPIRISASMASTNGSARARVSLARELVE